MPDLYDWDKFIETPLLMLPNFSTPLCRRERIREYFFAGQISGVEGYVECIATGLIAGVNASLLAAGEPLRVPPRSDSHWFSHQLSGFCRPPGLSTGEYQFWDHASS